MAKEVKEEVKEVEAVEPEVVEAAPEVVAESAPEAPTTIEASPSEPLRLEVFKFTFRHVQRIKDDKDVVVQTIPRSGELSDVAIGVDSQDAAKKIHAVYGEDIEFLGGSTVVSAVLA